MRNAIPSPGHRLGKSAEILGTYYRNVPDRFLVSSLNNYKIGQVVRDLLGWGMFMFWILLGGSVRCIIRLGT